VDWEDINRDVEELQVLADCPDTDSMLRKLKRIVPEYEASEVSAAHASRPRSDREREVAKVNGNGKRTGS
jgi:hypothetical protein